MGCIRSPMCSTPSSDMLAKDACSGTVALQAHRSEELQAPR